MPAFLDSLRELNAALGTLAVALIVWRASSRWDLHETMLSRVVVVLFGALVLIVALGTAYAAKRDLPLNPVQWAILVHFIVTIVVCMFWPRLLALRLRNRGPRT